MSWNTVLHVIFHVVALCSLGGLGIVLSSLNWIVLWTKRKALIKFVSWQLIRITSKPLVQGPSVGPPSHRYTLCKIVRKAYCDIELDQ